MKQYKNLSDNYAGASLVSIPCSLSRDEETYSNRLVSRELGVKYPDEYRNVVVMVPEGIDYTPDYEHISIDYTDDDHPGKVRVPVPGGFCWCRVLWEDQPMLPSIHDIRTRYNLTQAALAEMFGIPRRTVEDWDAGRRNPPDYVVRMILRLLELDK